ncbi:MAG: hypothetical protein K0S65_4771, partial [Labilithrix sp.]|nr:hypothetical protein [Labilithrix sp.]
MVHAPYRIAARPEPDPPDDADLYEQRLRARSKRGRRVITGICGALAALSLAALFETPPRRHTIATVEDRAAARIAIARDTIAAARDIALREQARFTATVNAALDADVAPDPREPQCDVELPQASRLVHGKQAFPLLVVARGDRALPSPSVATLLADVNRADEHLAAGRTVE